jgi:preprotein translocase subunit YajC
MDWILLVAMVALLGFMFWSSQARRQDEGGAGGEGTGDAPRRQGAAAGRPVRHARRVRRRGPVQGGTVELAPGVEVEVHSQAILRVVDDEDGTVTEDEFIEAEADQAEYEGDVANGVISSVSDDRAAEAEKVADTSADSGDAKPHA